MEMKMKPSHPGEIIKFDYLEPLGLTVTQLANSLSITRSMLSSIINERASVSPEMAIRLSKAFDTTPELWLGLQKSYDLFNAKEKFNPEGIVESVYSSQL